MASRRPPIVDSDKARLNYPDEGRYPKGATAAPLLPYAVQCQGKVPHRSRRYARVARKQQPWATLSIYKCPHCSFFHLGNHDAHRDEYDPRL